MRWWLHRCTALDAAAAAAACGAAGIAGFAVDCCGDRLRCAHAARKNGGRGAGVKVGTSAPEMVCCTFAQMCCIGADTSANEVEGVVIGVTGKYGSAVDRGTCPFVCKRAVANAGAGTDCRDEDYLRTFILIVRSHLACCCCCCWSAAMLSKCSVLMCVPCVAPPNP